MSDKGRRFMNILSGFHSISRESIKNGMNKGEFGVLKEICELLEINGSTCINVSALAEHMQCTMPMVSRSLKVLEEKEYILRETDPKDRRITLISVTEKGFERIRVIDSNMDGFTNSVFSRMGEDNAEEFLDLMEKFQEAIGEEIRERKAKWTKGGKVD